ncbi:MAG: hypothetical protein WD066_14500, partial [Planctomycetaceae bacterium]
RLDLGEGDATARRTGLSTRRIYGHKYSVRSGSESRTRIQKPRGGQKTPRFAAEIAHRLQKPPTDSGEEAFF